MNAQSKSPSPLAGEGGTARRAVTGEGATASQLDSRARQMRKEPTDAERKLWRLVRDRELDGLKFRRQVPLGRYIVDFICLDARLIVELGGSQHADNSYDIKRDTWLKSQDFMVIRFWNTDVLKRPKDVAETILAAAARSKHQ